MLSFSASAAHNGGVETEACGWLRLLGRACRMAILRQWSIPFRRWDKIDTWLFGSYSYAGVLPRLRMCGRYFTVFVINHAFIAGFIDSATHLATSTTVYQQSPKTQGQP